jgi:UDP:flavonoid glycosyltransferase YjiC (YdhE family)
MAKELHRLGFHRQRVFSMPSMTAPAESALRGTEIAFVPLIAERDDDALALANTSSRTFGNPLALLRQFRECVSLLRDMRTALLATWEKSQTPDLVIADSVVPSAGSAARERGARWWTSLSSVPSLEALTGTPSYVGGWQARDGAAWRIRDSVGRSAVRSFKRTAGFMCRKELRSLGFDAVYRKDGSEACYSDECILGLGLQELEFPRQSWPSSMRFVGAVLDSPVRATDTPRLDPGTRNVLISLGTHLMWAKERGLKNAVELARHLDGWTVHFSHGDVQGNVRRQVAERTIEHSYVPYGANLAEFDAIVHHGGTGVMYSSLGAGVPAVVWPHDFDQFDQAARLVHHGLALRAPKSSTALASDLQRLVNESEWRERCAAVKDLLMHQTPGERVAALIHESC